MDQSKIGKKPLDLNGIYEIEAKRIFDARREAQTMHATGDIRAAGNQVERTVRETIAKRLPTRYTTTHGHILDYNGHVSPQLDVIIAEGLFAKGLFKADDGTEYIPYESVYAFGEVKSTYYKADKPIEAFSRSLSGIHANLTRQTMIHHPLLRFMVFVAANDFSVADIEKFYRETSRDILPNFICLLDLGTVIFARFLPDGNGQPVPVMYHLPMPANVVFDEKDRWSLIRWGKNHNHSGANLMFLHLALIQHLNTCAPASPNLFPYFALSLDWDGGELFE